MFPDHVGAWSKSAARYHRWLACGAVHVDGARHAPRPRRSANDDVSATLAGDLFLRGRRFESTQAWMEPAMTSGWVNDEARPLAKAQCFGSQRPVVIAQGGRRP
jgi:hypothetical protein